MDASQLAADIGGEQLAGGLQDGDRSGPVASVKEDRQEPEGSRRSPGPAEQALRAASLNGSANSASDQHQPLTCSCLFAASLALMNPPSNGR